MSSVNFGAGTVATNLLTVDLAADRSLCFFASTPVDLIVDLFGVMAAPTGSLAERLSIDGYTWPPFSPSATDYAVECGTDGEATIDLATVASVSTRINGAPSATGAITVDAATDELVEVDLRRASERVTYHFRCLPADFPASPCRAPGRQRPAGTSRRCGARARHRRASPRSP